MGSFSLSNFGQALGRHEKLALSERLGRQRGSGLTSTGASLSFPRTRMRLGAGGHRNGTGSFRPVQPRSLLGERPGWTRKSLRTLGGRSDDVSCLNGCLPRRNTCRPSRTRTASGSPAPRSSAPSWPASADVVEVVRTCPWEVETMTVGELLRSQRRWGRARARKFLSSLALNENRELGRLTERQRGVLAGELEAKASTALAPALGLVGQRDRTSAPPPGASSAPRVSASLERLPERRLKARVSAQAASAKTASAAASASGSQTSPGEEGERRQHGDPERARQEQGVRAVAGEVLADRELEARPGRRARARPRSSRPLPALDHEPGDAASRARPRRPARPAETSPRAPAVARRALARGAAAGGRRFAAAGSAAGVRRGAGADGACGASCSSRRLARGRGPLANGQPEESLTRHQPISIPRMPQRGRECQWRQPGSPTSSLETRTHR